MKYIADIICMPAIYELWMSIMYNEILSAYKHNHHYLQSTASQFFMTGVIRYHFVVYILWFYQKNLRNICLSAADSWQGSKYPHDSMYTKVQPRCLKQKHTSISTFQPLYPNSRLKYTPTWQPDPFNKAIV